MTSALPSTSYFETAATRTLAQPGWSAERMAELGTRHSDAEGIGDLETLFGTLVDDPVYEFHPVGLSMGGGDRVRRFYEQFKEHFLPMRAGYTMLGEWVSATSVAQEYDISLRVDGVVETHRVLGILFADGDKLGGERVYASERFVRLMTGSVFDELESLDAARR